MKHTLAYFVSFSLLGMLSGCTGGSPPGLHKTRERPSSAIEPALEKNEKNSKDAERPTTPATELKKSNSVITPEPMIKSANPPVSDKK